MKKRLLLFATLWLLLIAVAVVMKVIFVTIEPAYTGAYMSQLPAVIAHGLSMDVAMTAYLMAPVLLWTLASVWAGGRVMTAILYGYLWFVAVLTAVVYMVDAVLYPYWGVRLDATPVFYFTTSPAAAMASLQWYWELLAVIVTALLAWGLERVMWWTARRFVPVSAIGTVKRRIAYTVVWLAIGGLMIIPIRGGVTVSTMSPARAYYSADIRLNHAAVNPMFNLVYSLLHVDTLGRQMRYYESDSDAQDLVNAYTGVPVSASDSLAMSAVRLRTDRPDVYVVILESFSNHLMPSLGGESVAVRLDSIAAHGVLFTNFWAESFRTDRAIPTILSGYPALPTTSVMRYPDKFSKLPSLASSLKLAGYSTHYYYGGDINFTNMNAYLVSTGFDHIVKDTDFAVSQRLSKWGVHDDVLFERVLADKRPARSLTVVQTSSSHEPFEVPYRSVHANERANAFAYADSCVAAFINGLHRNGQWDNALVVMVPDHWGAYPKGLTDYRGRHQVPLILTGGALAGTPRRIGVTGSQSSIAPTVLALMGLDNSDFYNPASLLDPAAGHTAWVAEPEWMGLVDNAGRMTAVNLQQDTANPAEIPGGAPLVRARAQLLYRDLDNR